MEQQLDPFPAHEDLNEQPLFPIDPTDRNPESEDERQREMVGNLRRRGFFVAHIPQSGRRSDYERVTLHRNGAIAGVPDLLICWLDGVYFAEVKDGRKPPSPAQVSVMNELTKRNIPCGVHRSWCSLRLRLIDCGGLAA